MKLVSGLLKGEKTNAGKYLHVLFALNWSMVFQVQRVAISSCSGVKYPEIITDKTLTWSSHLIVKRKMLNSRLHFVRSVLKSKLSMNAKTTIYQSFLMSIWAYSIQIWEYAKPSQIRLYKPFNKWRRVSYLQIFGIYPTTHSLTTGKSIALLN